MRRMAQYSTNGYFPGAYEVKPQRGLDRMLSNSKRIGMLLVNWLVNTLAACGIFAAVAATVLGVVYLALYVGNYFGIA